MHFSHVTFAVVVAVLVVVRSSIGLFLSTIEHHSEQTLLRHLIEELVDSGVASLSRSHNQKPTISTRHQHAGISKDSEWRSIDDDVVEHATHFGKQPRVA